MEIEYIKNRKLTIWDLVFNNSFLVFVKFYNNFNPLFLRLSKRALKKFKFVFPRLSIILLLSLGKS